MERDGPHLLALKQPTFINKMLISFVDEEKMAQKLCWSQQNKKSRRIGGQWGITWTCIGLCVRTAKCLFNNTENHCAPAYCEEEGENLRQNAANVHKSLRNQHLSSKFTEIPASQLFFMLQLLKYALCFPVRLL